MTRIRTGRPPCRRAALAHRLRTVVAASAVTAALAASVLLPAGGTTALSPAEGLAGDPERLVACGDGPAFPVGALGGPQGAEMASDGAARRLAQAATTGEAGYVPRGGWIRVVDEPDRAVFVTWLHLPRSRGGPLLQVTLAGDGPDVAGAAAWDIADAGFCWPRAVAPPGMEAVDWSLAAPAGAEDHRLLLQPGRPVCDAATLPDPVVVLTPEHVVVTLLAATDPAGCASGALDPIPLLLPEPVAGREVLDGSVDPPGTVQPAVVPAPAPRPVLDPAAITVTAAATPVTVAGSHAIADALGALPELVPVIVIDSLDLTVRLVAAEDVILAGPPRLCLVGPNSAPDDAGLIDRCWGEPDPGAALAPVLARTAGGGRPMLRAGEPVDLRATVGRGDVRCDYPPGAWRLEVVVTPLDDGHGWIDVPLADVPLDVDATGLAPSRELGRLESRYCGMATRPGASRAP